MSNFAVNPETLVALQQAVMGLALELEFGSQPTAQYASSCSPDQSNCRPVGVGAGRLNGADQVFDPFFQAWENSLDLIGQNMEDVANALGTAAAYYTEVDDHICVATQ